MDAIKILTACAIATLLVASFRALVPRPRLRLTRRGIFDGDGLGWIRWDEIEGAYPPSADDRSVRLRLVVSPRLAGRLRALRRRARAGSRIDWSLDLSDSGWSALDVIRKMMESRATR